MATVDTVRDPLINSYYDNSVMLDTAMSIDGFFEDICLLYAYKNWYDGEVVAGPSVKKYWVTIILKYDFKNMPEPKGAEVMTKLGCKVFYKKFKQKVETKVVGPQDLDHRHRPKTVVEPCWLIKIVIPKKFIENEELKDLDQLDQEVDVDQVEDTLNSGGENTALESNVEQTNMETQNPTAQNQMQQPTSTPGVGLPPSQGQA